MGLKLILQSASAAITTPAAATSVILRSVCIVDTYSVTKHTPWAPAQPRFHEPICHEFMLSTALGFGSMSTNCTHHHSSCFVRHGVCLGSHRQCCDHQHSSSKTLSCSSLWTRFPNQISLLYNINSATTHSLTPSLPTSKCTDCPSFSNAYCLSRHCADSTRAVDTCQEGCFAPDTGDNLSVKPADTA